MGIISKWLEQSGGMGNFIVIVGAPHTGKTTILCNLFEKSLKNFEVITTTELFRIPKGLHVINSASTLLRTYASISEKNVIIAIDDAQATFDSTSMASTKASKMNQTLYLFMAKLQANFIFVAHYLNKIPKPVIECEPLIIRALRPGLMVINNKIIKVRKTPYKFPKAFMPSWKWDINPYELYDKLSKIKGRTNKDIIEKNKKAIIDFLDNSNDKKIFKMSKKEQIKFLLEYKSMKQEYIAELVGCNQSTVSYYKKKYSLSSV